MADQAGHSWLKVPGVVLPVVDQGPGDICWALVATEAISSQYKALHADEDHLPLSVQQVVNCTKSWYLNMEVADAEKDTTFTINRVFLYAGAVGICLDRDYPFNREDKRCNPPRGTQRFFVQDFVVPESDEEIREAISKFPIAGATSIYNSFISYEEGIYAGPTLEEEINSSGPLGTHAILLTDLRVEDGIEMFEFKNSWADWGQDGIGKIRKELVFRISYPTGIGWSWPEKGLKSTMDVGVSKDQKRDGDEGGDGGDKRDAGTKSKGGKFSGLKGKTEVATKTDVKGSKGGRSRLRSGASGIEMVKGELIGQSCPRTGTYSQLSYGGDQEESSGPSPPQKKHKLDDRESHGAKEKEKEMPTSEKDSCCSNEIFTISDEQLEKLKLDYCPEGVEEIDRDVWTKYHKEIKESEGFDIYHYPGLCLMARFTPLDVDNFSRTRKDMVKLSKAAIMHFNKEKIKNYKLEKVEKANAQLWGAGVNYYITFQAKDSVTNAFDTFQALVWKGRKSSNPESIDVQFCRLKSVPAT